MRFLSVCSGIEAASVAWKPLGWTCVGVSEIEAFPRAVLEQREGAVAVDWDHRHTPNSNLLPMFGDFTQIRKHHVGATDLIVGGTPCQDYSIAGLRAGLDGQRGNLTREFSKLAYRTGSRWMVWENVPGAFSTNEGRDFGAILATFSGRHGLVFEPPSTGWGNAGIVEPADPDSYGLAWRVLDAQYFGIPQRRRRVFIVGYIGDWRPACAVLLERESLQGNPAPRRKAREGSSAFTPGSFGDYRPGCGTLRANGGDFGPGSQTIIATNQIPADVDGIVGTLSRQDHGGVDTQTALSGYILPAAPKMIGGVDGEHNPHSADKPTGPLIAGSRSGGGHPLPCIAFSAKDFGPDATEDLCPTLRSLGAYDANGGSTMAIAFKPGNSADSRSIGANEEVSCTLEAGGGGNNRQAVAIQGIANESVVRRLTPRECERLQGFPDDFTRIAWRGKVAEDCPDGPRYKALGNSMAVPVMRWIGERIQTVSEILQETEGRKL